MASSKASRGLIWAPRVVALAYILLLSVLSLDVLSDQASLGEKLVGLLMHNIPSIILGLLLFISWDRPGIGTCGFILLAVLFTAFFRTYENWARLAAITFPLVVVSGLFALTLVRSRRTIG
jgi:hypothetical protein